MIRLHQFAPAFGLPNASPFCMKLETWLRMAGIPFETPAASLGALMRAPKGKLPYIEDDGRIVADTSLIIEYLKVRHGDALDAWLDAEQRAVSLAFQRLMEENLYWALVHTRWIDPTGWQHTREGFFGGLPVPLRWFLPALARRGIRRELQGHGMGRHSDDDIHAIARRDLAALAAFLGDKPFFMGAQPCSLDAVAHAFLANILWAPVDSALRRDALCYPVFEDYCQRMRARYYP